MTLEATRAKVQREIETQQGGRRKNQVVKMTDGLWVIRPDASVGFMQFYEGWWWRLTKKLPKRFNKKCEKLK